MKVYIVGEAMPFREERYGNVFDSYTKAEKALKEKYPYCRKFSGGNGEWNSASGALERKDTRLLFIHEREVM